jgi:anaerobic nitric oxide reductase flavorubredoxin
VERRKTMSAVEIKPGIWWIGVNVRSHDLFEGLWPIPHGVSLNSYLVKGEKTAVVDLVREWSGSSTLFLHQLLATGTEPRDIDYVVLNHLEPDHTEFLRHLRRIAPQTTIVATPKGVEMVEHLYGITEKVTPVQDGEELALGGGKKLVFFHAPFVHWPETMMTYDPRTGVLFSCDAFGGFGALKGIVFDDQVEAPDMAFYYDEMLRYYANIVANFSKMVLRAIDKLAGIEISVIAPSHGLVWRGNPRKVIAHYKKFAGYPTGRAETGITLLWSSMYGNTRQATDAVMSGIAREKVSMEVFEVPGVHESYILASVFKNRGIAVGAPTYETKLFPPMAHVLDSVSRKRMSNKKAFRYGSYGWSGGAQREFDAFTEALKWEQSEPLEFRGAPTSDDLQRAEELAAKFARSIREGANG